MAIPVILETMRGANVARIVGTPLASGTMVEAGQILFEAENHKVVQEIDSPATGRLIHDLTQGDLLYQAMPIAFIAAEGEDAVPLLAEARRARAAASLAWDAIIAGEPLDAGSSGQRVSIAKATEIAVLANGAGNSLLASLGASIGRVPRSATTPNFFHNKILDLLVYEAARLLTEKRFRVLNSRFADGMVIAQDRVKAGISFDEGGRLTLYALADAEKLSLTQIQDAIVDGLMRYVGNRLSLEDVATSTFTISDVSAVPLSFSVPLLPRDQCFIIAVTCDEGGSFGLNMSFDHRVTEGLVAAKFAQELIKRIRSYSVEAAVPVGLDPGFSTGPAVCTYCERSVESETSEFRRRGLLKIIDAAHNEVLCCTACWEGW